MGGQLIAPDLAEGPMIAAAEVLERTIDGTAELGA